jgi:hypothetical protein
MTLDLAAIGIPDRVLTAAECFDAGVRAAQAIDRGAARDRRRRPSEGVPAG